MAGSNHFLLKQQKNYQSAENESAEIFLYIIIAIFFYVDLPFKERPQSLGLNLELTLA